MVDHADANGDQGSDRLSGVERLVFDDAVGPHVLRPPVITPPSSLASLGGRASPSSEHRPSTAPALPSAAGDVNHDGFGDVILGAPDAGAAG